jgi:glycosyltransferase involved in cell wall biosynthesis
MKYNILLFWFEDDWGHYGRTYEMVARHLAGIDDVDRVVCIFPPLPEPSREFLRPLSIREGSSRVSLIAQKRLRIPVLERIFPRLEKLGRLWGDFALRNHLRRLGFHRENTILWLFPPHPYLEKIIAMVPHAMVVTQVVDNFQHMEKTFWLQGYAQEQYPKLAGLSDLIITSSRENYDLFRKDHAVCHLFENAVDPIFLGDPSSSLQPRGMTPRLGYVGWITDRTDLRLLAHVAKSRPDWSIIIAGPRYGCDIDVSEISLLPNVEIRDPIPYHEVPAFLQSLDVCLIPHRDTAYSRSMSPLKLYQYLASGKPVVSTAVAGVEKFGKHLFMARDEEEFIRSIERALSEDTPQARSARIEAAKNETWERRVGEMFSAVRSRLKDLYSHRGTLSRDS